MTSSDELRVGVIGMGTMGRNHARIWSEMEGVELAAVCDVDHDRVFPVVKDHVVAFYTDYRDMLGKERLDAVSICTPTAVHALPAIEAMQAGLHVLVEKPIASIPEAALEMIRTAEARDRILMVGHIERFNPAVKALLARRDWLGEIRYMTAIRVGPPPQKPPPEGLIIDLAVHDLDLMPQIAMGAMTSIYCESDWRGDQAVATLRFAGGAVGTLFLSWLSEDKVRKMEVKGSLGSFELDFIGQHLVFIEGGRRTGIVAGPEDALRSELEIFAESVQHGYGSPVSGREGRAALVYAQAMADSAELGVVIDEKQLYERLLESPIGANGRKPAETVENAYNRSETV